MYKSICVLLLLFVGCQDKNQNNSKFVSGIVKDVQFIQEDQSHVYVLVHFEDRVVKLRSWCYDNFELPLNKEINIHYNTNNLCITKIESIEKKFQ